MITEIGMKMDKAKNGNEAKMEIGYQTDVKHVSHISWEGSSCSTPWVFMSISSLYISTNDISH